jgi:hypothetical protein
VVPLQQAASCVAQGLVVCFRVIGIERTNELEGLHRGAVRAPPGPPHRTDRAGVAVAETHASAAATAESPALARLSKVTDPLAVYLRAEGVERAVPETVKPSL